MKYTVKRFSKSDNQLSSLEWIRKYGSPEEKKKYEEYAKEDPDSLKAKIKDWGFSKKQDLSTAGSYIKNGFSFLKTKSCKTPVRKKDGFILKDKSGKAIMEEITPTTKYKIKNLGESLGFGIKTALNPKTVNYKANREIRYQTHGEEKGYKDYKELRDKNGKYLGLLQYDKKTGEKWGSYMEGRIEKHKK